MTGAGVTMGVEEVVFEAVEVLSTGTGTTLGVGDDCC